MKVTVEVAGYSWDVLVTIGSNGKILQIDLSRAECANQTRFICKNEIDVLFQTHYNAIWHTVSQKLN